MPDDTPKIRTIPIRRSLNRPDMIFGAEADPVFATGIISVAVAMSAPSLFSLCASIVFWLVNLFIFRIIAQKDPIRTQVYFKTLNYKKFYPRRAIAWDQPKSPGFVHFRGKQTKGFSNLLQYAACIEDGILLLKDGSFLAGFRFRSIDTASCVPEELAVLTAKVNNALKDLGDGWMIQVDAVRTSAETYPPRNASHFPDTITLAIEEERREHYQAVGRHFTTENILYLTYKPSLAAEKLSSFAYQTTGDHSAKKEPPAAKALRRYQEDLAEVEDTLSAIMWLERLLDYEQEDEHGQKHTYSTLLSYIQHAITGDKHPVMLPRTPFYLDCLIGGQDLTGGVTPKIGDKYIGVVAIDGFPLESWPTMLSTLDGLPLSYRFSSRYICMGTYTAKKEIEKHRKGWAQKEINLLDKFFPKPDARVNQDARNMSNDAELAIADVQSGLVSAGHYAANIVLMNENKQIVVDWGRELRTKISRAGFGSRIEEDNCIEAWQGTHPGNGHSNVRQCIVNSLNFTDLLPLSTIWAGREICPNPMFPKNSPPLLFAETEGATPFRLNLHVGDLGHTMIMGPTGSGKSTLMALLAAQAMRYPHASVIAFDKGFSMYALIKGAGGTHYHIGGDNSQLAFCPLQHVTSDFEQSWAAEWIAALCELQQLRVQPKHQEAIHDAMKQIRNNPSDLRTLSEFFHLVQDEEIKSCVRHYTRKGDMGRLLDAPKDYFGFSRMTCFELEDLLPLGDKNVIPVLEYIFHRIEKSLTGKPTFMFLDEAWTMFGHKLFVEKIRGWLKELRKANCAVIMGTQSLSDTARSGIQDVLMESCPLKIFLANAEATQDINKEMYRQFGLNNRQIEIIANATSKRDYYVVSPEGRRKITLNLGPVAKAFVGTSGKEQVAHIKELEESYGYPQWTSQWLNETTQGVYQ